MAMRIEFRPLTTGFTTPLPAAGGDPRDTCERLAARGCELQIEKRSWWGIGSPEWKPASPEESASALRESQPVKVFNGSGQWVGQLYSTEDLRELDGFQSKDTQDLPSPLLAGALAVLEGKLTVSDGEGKRRSCNAFEAYNVLTRDPNHAHLSSVQLRHGGTDYPLHDATRVETAAFLIAGFGDPQRVDARARNLKALAEPVPDLYRTYFSSGAVSVRVGNFEVERLSPQDLSQPDAVQRAEEAKANFQRLKGVLRSPEPAWPVVKQHLPRVPLEEQAKALQQLGDELLPAYSQALKMKAPLDQAVPVLLDLGGKVADKQQIPQVFAHLFGKPELQERYLGVLEYARDPAQTLPVAEKLKDEQLPLFYQSCETVGFPLTASIADRLEQDAPRLASLKPLVANLPGAWKAVAGDPPEVQELMRALLAEQGKPVADVGPYRAVALKRPDLPTFRQAVQTLVQREFSPADAFALAARAVEAGRLDADLPRLARLGPPAEAPANYRFMLEKVRPGDEESYLSLLAELPAKQVSGVWSVVSAIDGETAARLEAWRGFRADTNNQKPGLPEKLVAAVKAGGDLVWAREAFGKVKELDAFQKALATPDPKLVVELVAAGVSFDKAARVSETTGRKNFPGRELPAPERAEALGTLARVNGGSLERALDDFQFLAAQLEDTGELPQAAGFLAELRQLGLPDREARLAFGDLRRRQVDPAYGPLIMDGLKLAGTYAGARPIWDALLTLAPEEASRRLQGMAPLGEELRRSLPTEQLARVVVAQLTTPLAPEGLDELATLLGGRTPVSWEGPGRPDELKAGQELRTDPLHIPTSGDHLILAETFHKTSYSNGGTLALTVDDKAVTLGSGSDAWRGTSTTINNVREGTRLGLRVREGRSNEVFRVRKMVMLPKPLSTVSLVKENELTVPATPCYLQLIPDGPGTFEVSRDRKTWETVARFEEEARVDLEPYRGQKIYVRATGVGFGIMRAQGDDFTLRLTGRPALEEETFERVMRVAFDALRSPEQRGADLAALGALSGSGDELAIAARMWGDLSPDLPREQLEDRAAAVAVLRKNHDENEVLELCRKLNTLRQGDERLQDLARLMSGRDMDEFLKMRARVQLECGSEATPGTALRFLADFQGKTDPIRTDRVWQYVSRPIRGETLQSRIQGFHALFEALKGDVDVTTQTWEQISSRLDPVDDLGSAARAVAELSAVLGGELKKTQSILQGLQKLQEGPLEGRTLHQMARVLITRSLLADGDLTKALQRLPQEMPATTGVEERDEMILVGGVTVKKRAGE